MTNLACGDFKDNRRNNPNYIHGDFNNPPAFPVFDSDGTIAVSGLSKKEYISAQIFSQTLQSYKVKDSEIVDKARLAIKAAEILIKELEE